MQLISIIEIMGKHSKSQRKYKWSAIALPRDTHCCSFRVSSNLLSVMLTHCLALHPLTASRMAQGLNRAVIPWGKTTSFIPTEFNAALVTGQNKKTLCIANALRSELQPEIGLHLHTLLGYIYAAK